MEYGTFAAVDMKVIRFAPRVRPPANGTDPAYADAVSATCQTFLGRQAMTAADHDGHHPTGLDERAISDWWVGADQSCIGSDQDMVLYWAEVDHFVFNEEALDGATDLIADFTIAQDALLDLPGSAAGEGASVLYLDIPVIFSEAEDLAHQIYETILL